MYSVVLGAVACCPPRSSLPVDEYRANLVGNKPAVDPVLTVREREVLQLVAEGATSQEIAAQLGRPLAPGRVRTT